MVRALCERCNQTMVLVLTPNTLQHDALYKVVPTGVMVPDGTPLWLSAAGDSLMYMVLRVGETLSHWALLREPVLTVVPVFEEGHFNTRVRLNLTVTNFGFDGNLPLSVYDDTQLLNAQTTLSIDMRKLSVQASELLTIKKDTHDKVITLGD